LQEEYENRLQQALEELREVYDKQMLQSREDFSKLYDDRVSRYFSKSSEIMSFMSFKIYDIPAAVLLLTAFTGIKHLPHKSSNSKKQHSFERSDIREF
jgi:hypothetical protein